MRCRNLVTSSQALYRVFIGSSLPPISTALHYGKEINRIVLPCQANRALFQQVRDHRAVAYRKVEPEQSLLTFRVLNEAIKSTHVHVVGNSDKGFPAAQTLEQVLRNLDRKRHYLMQVSETSPSGYPIAKVIEKAELRAKHDEVIKSKKKQPPAIKQLEMGWSIDGNDLAHRLRKLDEFLRQGRKVEIIIARKKNTRTITKEEGFTLVDKIKAAASAIPGAKEFAPMDGVVGRKLLLTYQGQAEPDQKKTKDIKEVGEARLVDDAEHGGKEEPHLIAASAG